MQITAIIFLLILWLPSALAASPKIQELVDKATATRSKLQDSTCSWKITLGPGDGQGVEIHTTQTAKLTAFRFTIIQGTKRDSAGDLFIDEQFWYSRNLLAPPAKCRPYEADLFLPSFYALLVLAQPRYADIALLDQAELVRTTNGLVHLLLKSGPAYENTKLLLAKLSRLYEEDPALRSDPKIKKTFDNLRLAVEKGIELAVDDQTGLLRKFQIKPGYFASVSELSWTARPPVLPKEQWVDRTGVPEGLGENDLIMFGHAALAETKDLDTYLLSPRSNQARRIPARGGVTLPGCFLPGRRTALVHEQNLLNGGLSPRRVIFETGESEEFFPEVFKGYHMSFGGSVSPDQKSVALLMMRDIGEIDRKQILTVNLADGTATKIGAPQDYTSVHWLPSGKEFLAGRMEWIADPHVPPPRSVCIIDLQGRVKKIADGDQPVPLPPNRILFQRKNGSWATMTSNGSSVRSFAPRLPENCGFPAVSPDGKKVLFIQFGDSAPLGRAMVDIASGEITTVQNKSGVWTTPVW